MFALNKSGHMQQAMVVTLFPNAVGDTSVNMNVIDTCMTTVEVTHTMNKW